MARQNGVHDLRNDGIVVAYDAGKDSTVVVIPYIGTSQACDQIFPEFVLHMAGAQPFFRKGTAAQFAERAWNTHRTPEGNTFFDYTRWGTSRLSPVVRR